MQHRGQWGGELCGQGHFVSYGEHLFIEDRVADGHSAVARYWLDGGTGPFLAWNSRR